MLGRMTGLAVVVFAGQAAAQPVLYGVRTNGDLVRINRDTGAATLVGSGGAACEAMAGFTADAGRGGVADVLIVGGGPEPDVLTYLNRWSGETSGTLVTVGRPEGYTIRAMAVQHGFYHIIYTILGSPSTNLLATIDRGSGQYTVIGPMGQGDLSALAVSPAGAMWALGCGNGGTLYSVDPATGATTAIGGGGFGTDTSAMTFGGGGTGAGMDTLWAAGANLVRVDPPTGGASHVGPTGFTDITGLAFNTSCYANCEPGGPPPMLNVVDFLCFQFRYAAGDPYANCDGSTVEPVLNVNDFLCFMRAWANACE